jgi:predicted nucleic acid-binding protein
MLFDTSAWIEFFQGTNQGKKVRWSLKTEENFTSIITFAEVINWCLRNNLENKIDSYVNGIKKVSGVLDLDENIITLAGRLNFERKKMVRNWGMMDSFILATSLLFNLKILTKDLQFKDLKNVEIL